MRRKLEQSMRLCSERKIKLFVYYVLYMSEIHEEFMGKMRFEAELVTVNCKLVGITCGWRHL